MLRKSYIQQLYTIMSQKVNFIMSQKLSFLLSHKQNTLMSQKVNFLMSQKLNLSNTLSQILNFSTLSTSQYDTLKIIFLMKLHFFVCSDSRNFFSQLSDCFPTGIHFFYVLVILKNPKEHVAKDHVSLRFKQHSSSPEPPLCYSSKY